MVSMISGLLGDKPTQAEIGSAFNVLSNVVDKTGASSDTTLAD